MPPAEPKPTEKQRKNAPFIYACQFNKTQDLIMAGGAGANQIRIFDYKTGACVCAIN